MKSSIIGPLMSELGLLHVSDNKHLMVDSDLNVNTVARLKDEGIALIDTLQSPVVVDLAGARVQGSAAVALLIAWQRHCVQRHRDLQFINASSHLLEIAKVCDVEDILAFTDA